MTIYQFCKRIVSLLLFCIVGVREVMVVTALGVPTETDTTVMVSIEQLVGACAAWGSRNW
uniref:Uncharacterized protein n=1 Tax=Anguilla anguilla TaxID=7936 RepID=A0A0E9XY40_ANGAN